jgi:hypothetical protein
LGILIAYEQWNTIRRNGPRAKEREFIRKNFLSYQALDGIQAQRKLFYQQLAAIGFTKTPYDNSNSDNQGLIKAILSASLYPNVAVFPPSKPALTAKQGPVEIHPSSVNYNAIQPHSVGDERFVVFLEKVMTSRVFLRDSTMVSALSLLVFAGHIDQDTYSKALILDDWLRFSKVDDRTANALLGLREEIQSLLLLKVENPTLETSRSNVVIAAVAALCS